MNYLQVTARFRLHRENLDEFKKYARECLALVKERDRDTIQYDWFFNEDETECVVHEQYPDSASLLDHIAHVDSPLSKLMKMSEFTAEIYGEPSRQFLEATSNLDVKTYSFFQGEVTSDFASSNEQIM